jgi:hypothetical protein
VSEIPRLAPCYFGLFQAHPMCCAALFFSQSSDLQLMPSFSLSKEKKDTIYLFLDRSLSPVMTINKLVAALIKAMRSQLRKKGSQVGMMEHYLNWAQALASAWAFMLLLGLICCCLTTKPRHQQGSTGSATASCSCDAGLPAL